MFEEYQICPYTGLRSFTEEESLYFKGREEHIEQATEQLQRNKFLMLTGASGDGKSSLVYAGIVPNARAGFLKSHYTQWCVADFRPERAPFKNLCKAVARQLEIPNPITVESELQHGFSALVDLYRNSKRFVDTDSLIWKNADEQQKAALKRTAGNLIIIVDQFEEFFSNPENYHRGVPSRESNLVLNILLETSRISLEEDLPIYVVFTMRSDYIGQCAAFRTLPEYIGFSQFFVPRLNRSQLQQVIEEPAALSGNKITRRLTERLIHDIAEGVDQLPILQHALNQIWHAANKGKDEMDLLHYAMVGGMPSGELPDQQETVFKKWFEGLPENVKACYYEPNLQNVLDTHANKLFESAAESYRITTGNEISSGNAKEIIKKTFTCLTKIDESRAVRNRMTLQEITQILGRSGITTKEVGTVLNIFREPGNTFIRPFITEEPDSNTLIDTNVLDITHESLIRNWEYLGEWAKEEFDNYSTFLDFEKQLNRWVESDKSSAFLLSIGPLTYFEGWYNKVKPNAWWIARYLPEDIDQKQKLVNSEIVLANAQEFIRRSANKHLVTRTIMRYGPKRIAAVLAILAFVVLSSFVARNYMLHQNAYILKNVKEQSLELANSSKINFYDKATLLCEELKAGNSTINEIVDHVDDSLTKINVASRMGGMLVVQGRREPKQEILQSLTIAENLLKGFSIRRATVLQLTSLVKNANYLRNAIGLACVYNPSKELVDLRKENADYSALIVKHILKEQPVAFKEINQLNATLENAINYNSFSDSDIQLILEKLSPFENSNRSEWILKNYAKDNLAQRGNQNYYLKFNGFYQELAYLYAARGNYERALQSIDTLLAYNQNYYQNDYSAMADNATNIAVVFYAYSHNNSMDLFVKGYCAKKKLSVVEFYQRLIGRCHIASYAAANMNEFGGGSLVNLNCQLSDEKTLMFLFERYRVVINNSISKNDERNFLLSLSYKDEAMLRFSLNNLQGDDKEKELLFGYLDKAFEIYRKIDPKFLEEELKAAMSSDNDSKQVPRKFLFLYPDYRTTFAPFEPRNYLYYYTSSFFVEYLSKKDLISEFYDSEENLAYFSKWLEAIQFECSIVFKGADVIRKLPNTRALVGLESKLASRNVGSTVDFNLLYLTLGDEAMNSGNLDRVNYYYSKINKEKIDNLFRKPEFLIRLFSFYKIARLLANFSSTDKFPEAYSMVKLFKNPINRSSLYAFAARSLAEQKATKPIVQQLLDSSLIELTRIKNLSTGQPNRQVIAHALALQDPEKNAAQAYGIIKNIGNKFDPTLRISRAFAFHNNLYGAQQQIINNISDGDRANFLWNILLGYSQGQGVSPPEWKEFTDNYLFFKTQALDYVNENN